MSDDVSSPAKLAMPVTPPDGMSMHAPVAATLEAARERTIRVLTDRFADDSLTLEEFESWLDRMYKAQSAADLDLMLSEVERRAVRQAAAIAPAYAESMAPRRLLSLMSNTERTGRWTLPRRLEVRSVMSSILLDLREALLPPGLCEIDVLSLMANIEIIVPPGVVVEELALGVMANVENHVLDDGTVPADAPRIRITGTAVMANIEVHVAPPGLRPHKAIREAEREWKRRLRGR